MVTALQVDAESFAGLDGDAFLAGFFVFAVVLELLDEVLEGLVLLLFFAVWAALVAGVVAAFVLHFYGAG